MLSDVQMNNNENIQLDQWVMQCNEHWQQLLLRMNDSPSRKTLRQIASSLFDRIERQRPDELDVVCDSLQRTVEHFSSEADEPFALPGTDATQAEIDSINRQNATQAFLVLSIFADVALKSHYDAREKAGTRLFEKLLDAPATVKVLCSIQRRKARTNTELQTVLGVSESRVSQILKPLKASGLIAYTQSGTRRIYRLTASGSAALSLKQGIAYKAETASAETLPPDHVADTGAYTASSRMDTWKVRQQASPAEFAHVAKEAHKQKLLGYSEFEIIEKFVNAAQENNTPQSRVEQHA
jgi:DNA-binding MarR family transcriptional regulator